MKEIFTRVNQYLLFLILLAAVLYFSRPLLIPVIFAALLAMLMAPICRKLDAFGFHRALSSLACILILLAFLVGVGLIIKSQFSAFAKDVTLIEKKGREFIGEAQQYIEKQVGVSEKKQDEMVKKQTQDAGNAAGALAAKILAGLTAMIAGIAITLVFTFLLLYGKEKYQTFFLKLYKDQDQKEVRRIIDEISTVSQKYLTGRVMSITIIAILYAIGLLIVGIKNALLLAGIAALMTLVPFVGTTLGGLFAVAMAIVTEDSMQPAVLAAVVMFVIQTIDNYFIEPNVVGGEVNLSALFSILSVIAGGLIWGVAGMILFLPILGIVKIVCDHVESLRPIGYLVGDPNGKRTSRLSEWFKEKLGKGKASRK